MTGQSNRNITLALKWTSVLGAGTVALGGLALSLFQPPKDELVRISDIEVKPSIELSEAQINQIANRVRDQIEKQPSARIADTTNIDTQIEDYLLRRPEILISMSQALEQRQASEQRLQMAQFLNLNKQAIYHSEDDVVVGNPDGDVTIVEFFDYNCHFCQQAAPELIALLEEDKNLRVVFKEFPALSAESVDAARIAYLVGQSGKDYFSFHMDLMSSRGTKNAEKALDLASELGLDPQQLQAQMNDDKVTEVLGQTQALAQQLGIRGTPAFIIGNEVVPGYIDREQIKQIVANMRQCGNAECGT